jgi:hypothetical protein
MHSLSNLPLHSNQSHSPSFSMPGGSYVHQGHGQASFSPPGQPSSALQQQKLTAQAYNQMPSPYPSIIQVVLLIDAAPASKSALDAACPTFLEWLKTWSRSRKTQYHQQQQQLHSQQQQQMSGAGVGGQSTPGSSGSATGVQMLEVEWAIITFGASQVHCTAWMKSERDVEMAMRRPDGNQANSASGSTSSTTGAATAPQQTSAVPPVTSTAWGPPGTLSIWKNRQILDALCAARSLLQIHSPGCPVERHVFVVSGSLPMPESVDDCRFCFQPHTSIDAVRSFRDLNQTLDVSTAGPGGGLTVLALQTPALPPSQMQLWKNLVAEAGSPISDPPESAPSLLQRVRGALLIPFLNIMNNVGGAPPPTQPPAVVTTAAPTLQQPTAASLPPSPVGPVIRPAPVATQPPQVVNVTAVLTGASSVPQTAAAATPVAVAAQQAGMGAPNPTTRTRVWAGQILLASSGATVSLIAVSHSTASYPALAKVNWPPLLGQTTALNSQTVMQLKANPPPGPTFEFVPQPDAQQGGSAAPWAQLLGELIRAQNQSGWLVVDIPTHSLSIWLKAFKQPVQPGQQPPQSAAASIKVFGIQAQSLAILQQTIGSRLQQPSSLATPQNRGVAAAAQAPSIQPMPGGPAPQVSVFQQQTATLQQQQQQQANARYSLSASNNTISLNSSTTINGPTAPVAPSNIRVAPAASMGPQQGLQQNARFVAPSPAVGSAQQMMAPHQMAPQMNSYPPQHPQHSYASQQPQQQQQQYSAMAPQQQQQQQPPPQQPPPPTGPPKRIIFSVKRS